MRKPGLVLIVLVFACQLTAILGSLQAAAPISSAFQIQQLVTPLPTHTPRPLFASLTPSFTPPPSATLAPTLIPSPTPLPALGHLVLARPILDVGSGVVSRAYPYGGTNGGRLQVHHGVDLVNPIGTPIHAAADGTVVYAGDDFTNRFAPINNYYGYLVIIQHDFLSPEGLPVFTLYGHMQQVIARAGQVVAEGDVIGIVGATGIALGPHLHFEVRVGSPFDFDATRNPEMWMRPYPGFSVLAGRVTDTSGNFVYGVTLDVQSSEIARKTYTYGDDSVHPDEVYVENFAIGDLPADDYIVSVTQNGRLRFQQHVQLLPDQMTWLDVPLPP